MGFNPVQKMCKDQVVGKGTVGGWRLSFELCVYIHGHPPPPNPRCLLVNWKLWEKMLKRLEIGG